MLKAARLAFGDIMSPPFRSVLVTSLALTVGLLAALWAALAWSLSYWIDTPWAWLDWTISVLTGIGLVVALAFLVAPVAALFVGLFLDDIAERVERTHYPHDPVGTPLPLMRALATSLTFLGAVFLVSAIALPLSLALGFGFAIFLAANAYLLGREFFELAALRHHDEAAVRRMRLRHGGRIFMAGLAIAAFLAVPILNLLGPLFATAFMVHVQKQIAADERRSGRLPNSENARV